MRHLELNGGTTLENATKFSIKSCLVILLVLTRNYIATFYDMVKPITIRIKCWPLILPSLNLTSNCAIF